MVESLFIIQFSTNEEQMLEPDYEARKQIPRGILFTIRVNVINHFYLFRLSLQRIDPLQT